MIVTDEIEWERMAKKKNGRPSVFENRVIYLNFTEINPKRKWLDSTVDPRGV